ncbi:MAG: hypothetical protein PHW73_05620 [Atribacterota bacterium]|nr:hypothetical protein [Atribacterota bacterium]
MKKFIFKVFVFIIIFISLLISYNILFYLYNSNMENCYLIDKSKDILILGDSNTECAINDSIVSKSVNLSQSADAYFYSFIKLRKFLKINPNIETVILGINEKSLYNHELFKSNEYIRSKYNSYFRLMNLNDFRVLLEAGGIKAFINLAEASFYNFSRALTIQESDYKDMNIGGYLYLIRDKLDETIERYKKENKQNNINIEYSKNQIEYLLKIVSLCKEYKVKLILLSTPTYMYCTNENDFYKLNQFLKKNMGDDIDYWDYSSYSLPDFCYGDIDHLNYKGTEVFSKKLNDDIKKYLHYN